MIKAKSTIFQSGRLRDQIYRLNRDDSRIGALVPGERLIEVTLAKNLRVSPTPRREAL